MWDDLLIVSGASDDLVEFEGVLRDEHNIYSATNFTVSATKRQGGLRILEVRAEYRYDWRFEFKARLGSWDVLSTASDSVLLIRVADDETIYVVRDGEVEG